MTDTVDSELVEKSRKIHKSSGKTFYLATKMFPERIRHQTYVLYAFFRKADEIVDTTEEVENQGEKLETFRQAALGNEQTDDPVLKAFNIVRKKEGIKDEDIDAFISAMEMDIDKDRYQDYGELSDYMDGSASAVGRMMTDIMCTNGDNQDVKHFATSLGEAYQMSNFIRDVREDIEDYGRIYIPIETIEENNASTDSIHNKDSTKRLKDALRYEMDRTEQLYIEGVQGIKYLPEDCQFAVLISAVLYSEHHRRIRNKNFEVFEDDMNISQLRKIRLLIRTRFEWYRNKNPEEVFHKVSCVGSQTDSSDKRFGTIRSLGSTVSSYLTFWTST